MQLRIGLGHDTHRLAPGGPLRLAGIDIEFNAHLVGHSDADVLLHAITDSLLGAANLGDIGQLFSDKDPANAGRDSAEMLAMAYGNVQEVGWRIINLDCVVLAQKPKLLPHKARMCQRIAEILLVDAEQVSLKGKTGEETGDVGQGLIMQAMCVCLLGK